MPSSPSWLTLPGEAEEAAEAAAAAEAAEAGAEVKMVSKVEACPQPLPLGEVADAPSPPLWEGFLPETRREGFVGDAPPRVPRPPRGAAGHRHALAPAMVSEATTTTAEGTFALEEEKAAAALFAAVVAVVAAAVVAAAAAAGGGTCATFATKADTGPVTAPAGGEAENRLCSTFRQERLTFVYLIEKHYRA